MITFSQPQNELKLAQIDATASVDQIVAGFVPPPRFAQVSFANYQPDPTQPSQKIALERLELYVANLVKESQPPPTGLFGRWRKPSPLEIAKGIYLDGGYGVGKTHLLASAYQAAPSPRAYLSFQELAYIIGAMGMQNCLAAFQAYRLICVDEFELDDVGNTMLAKTFITNLTQTRLITTSNTLPSDLGHGRFAAEDFRREIGQIAAVFEVVRIEGQDYRQRSQQTQGIIPKTTNELKQSFAAYQPQSKAKLYASFDELTTHLSNLHPIGYSRLLTPLEAVFIADLTPIIDQNVALRFVHFIDKLYDRGIRFAASANCELIELFAAEYRDKGYAKKYRRCLSRLQELLNESK